MVKFVNKFISLLRQQSSSGQQGMWLWCVSADRTVSLARLSSLPRPGLPPIRVSHWIPPKKSRGFSIAHPFSIMVILYFVIQVKPDLMSSDCSHFHRLSQNCLSHSHKDMAKPWICTVPDRRRRILPEVVLVRRGVIGVLGIWRGEGLVEGLGQGRSVYKQPETEVDGSCHSRRVRSK